MASYKVESGMQLLARLSRKPNIENFYPTLFQAGLRYGDVIELYSDEENLLLLELDLICEALLPTCIGGMEVGVVIFNCNSNFDYDILVNCLQSKLNTVGNFLNSSINRENLLEKALNNLFILEIFDVTQLYTTIYNLENLLLEHSNVGMIFFDTITAFYWSEQGYKIIKMDVYIKRIINLIQSVTKEHKITCFYTRPEYFSSVKNNIENLEPCCETQQLERLNYRIQMLQNKDGTCTVHIKTFNRLSNKKFRIIGNIIKWL